MSNPNLQKIIKLTQSQYNTLANGGTIGDFTGLNDNYLYLIQEDYEFPTTTTARKILMSTSTAGLVEWQSLTANDIPSLAASKINSGTFDAARIPNLNASKITAGTFDVARIPNLDASKITSGTFADDRIASASTWNAKYTKPSGGIPASDLAESYSLSTHNHDTRYLKLSGGTMTGNISYQGSLSTNAMIKFLNNTSDAYGNGIAIGGGGIVIIGAGESSDLSYGSAGDENLYLAADTAIHFYSNAQSGLSSAKHMIFDNSGVLQGMNSIVVTHPSGGGSEYKINSTNYSISFMIGSGDINRGIYDHTNNSWMIYRDDTTNVYINGAIYENGTALSNKYLAKNAQAKDSAKLNGQEASYYLNYNNLTNKPTIPSVSNATITIKQTGISDQTFTLNGSAVTITLVDTNTWRPLGTGSTDACAGNDSRLSDARPASDVYAWAKASTKPTYTYSEVGAAASNHNHDTVYLKLSGGTLTGHLKWNDSSALPSATNLGITAEYILCIKAFADGGDTFYETKSNFLSGYATTTWVGNNYLGKNAKAADSSKLNGQAASYYLNYNNLSNTPSSLPASDVYAWAKAATKPSYTASEVGALASDAKVVLYSVQSLTNIQKATARLNIGAGTSDLEIGNTATTAAAGNHTHTLSITSGGSSPTTLAANTTYTLTAGGSTLVFKTPAAGGGSAYYANQYNQWYYFSNSQNPYISSQIGLTNIATYNYANLFFGFNSIPEDFATSLSNGHNIKTSSRSFIMDLAIGSGYMSQLVFGTIGYDITCIYARTIDAWGGYVGEPDEISKLGMLYLEAKSLYGTKVVNNSRYEFAIGRRRHCFIVNSGTTFRFYANLKNDNTASITTLAGLCAALYNAGFRSSTKFLIATGIYGSYTKPVVGIYATASSSGLTIMYMNGTTQTTTSVSSATVSDSDDGAIYEP